MQDGRNPEGNGGGQAEERGDEERGKEGGRRVEGGEEGVARKERGRERERGRREREGEGVERVEEEGDSEGELTLLNQSGESLLEEARPRLIINIM